MPATLIQTVAGATQYDGTAGKGLFDFSFVDSLPRTTGVIIHTLSYFEESSGPPLTTNVQFFSVKPAGVPTARVPLGDGEAAAGLLDVNGAARLKLCGHVLEKNPGKFGTDDQGLMWAVLCFTKMKTENATITLTYDLCDFNESDLRGSREI